MVFKKLRIYWLYSNMGKPLLKEDRINKLWLFLDAEGSLSSLNGGQKASKGINMSSVKVNSSSSNSNSLYN